MTELDTRIERDSHGEVAVPATALWGAQTQRALAHFSISTERMAPELILALALVKRCAAEVNAELGLLDADTAHAIVAACDEVLAGDHTDAFPLAVWQSGSGTQTNMNMNEVLANRATALLADTPAAPRRVHPNDHVNLGQSTNDIFPTALHVAAVAAIESGLLPALRELRCTLAGKAEAFAGLVKIGRTHLQDAVPLTLGQEVSGWGAQLDHAIEGIANCLAPLRALAVGGTAVGTGLNTHAEFGARVAQRLAKLSGTAYHCAPNRFAALASHDPLLSAHGALRTLAAALMKIANDVRWLASGPRCGLGELQLPENEPGSSIMPGKVNPTQCEAMAMVCCQVFGNDVALGFGGASGNFELNAFKPLIAHNFLQSARLLADAVRSFDRHCAQGLAARPTRIAEHLEHSLMLATALSPHIGYDHAAEIARTAFVRGTTLRAAAIASGYVSPSDFDDWVRPERMI
ncbi:class II fumarate hydratase [Niveibacterium microcysteis]|uniref:Fumarate hydratase class II n=1 Tax=Niveibacterium microcysteis TaxID=2811415 RepID=A0ABX7MF93_9RHOO|nr:class II fumarate hydratase [Niveibacterium microcysteis]QSI78647.1 class II fumarate hydratase [Niveibacterium microcysteis]